MKMKYAVVTGSTKGIGKAIAIRLLKEGYYVIINYSNDDNAAAQLEDEAKEYEGRFSIIKEKLSDYEAAISFAQKVKGIIEHIDCIVFNCGMTDRSAFCDISRESWEQVMNTNLNVPLYILQYLNDSLNPGGKIIFIGSILGIYPHASSLGYAVSKAAVHQMAKELVKVFADRCITVNAIASGFVDTPWQSTKPKEQKKRIEEKIALKRFGYPEEIANLCMTIIDTSYINGAVLEISGGYSYR